MCLGCDNYYLSHIDHVRIIISVQNHVTPLLKDLHWLLVPERITYKLCTLTFRCLNGSVLQYLSKLLQPVADLESRQKLWLSSTSQLVLPCMQRSTISDRAFTVSTSQAWNSLPDSLHRCHQWNNARNFWKLRYLKLHLCMRTVFIVKCSRSSWCCLQH